MLVVIFINSKQYKTKWWEILPSEYNFVSDCKYGYKICLTFRSQMSLSLQEW